MRNSPSCVWLGNLRDWMTEQAKNGEKYSIVTCSALKRQYRDILRGAEGKVAFIHLTPPQAINLERMLSRQGHYMKAGMLDSQLWRFWKSWVLMNTVSKSTIRVRLKPLRQIL